MQTEAARRWALIVAESERSPLSQREFAERRGLNARTLAWWKWRLRRESDESDSAVGTGPSGSRFVELVVEPRAMPRSSVRIQIGEFAHIDADEDTDLALLRQVLEAIS